MCSETVAQNSVLLVKRNSLHMNVFFLTKQQHKSAPVLKSPLYILDFTVTEIMNNYTQTVGAEMRETEKHKYQEVK